MSDAFPFSGASNALPVTYHEAGSAMDLESGQPAVMLHLKDANGGARDYLLTRSQAYALALGVFEASGGRDGLAELGFNLGGPESG